MSEDKKFLYSDVDETLLKWPKNPHKPRIIDYKQIEFNGTTYYLKPHKKNIETLKKFANQGYKIIIWSLGGEAWAKKACEVLELEPYVTHCLAKPDLIIDDLSPKEWMPENLYQVDEEQDE